MTEIPSNDFNHQAVIDADVEKGVKSILDQLKVERHHGVAQLRIIHDSRVGPDCDSHYYDRKATDIIAAKFKEKGYFAYYTSPSNRWGRITHLTISKEPRYGNGQIHCCTAN